MTGHNDEASLGDPADKSDGVSSRKCWPRRNPLWMALRLVSVVAFSLSWVHWAIVMVGLVPLVCQQRLLGRCARGRWNFYSQTNRRVVVRGSLVGGLLASALAFSSGEYIKTHWAGIGRGFTYLTGSAIFRCTPFWFSTRYEPFHSAWNDTWVANEVWVSIPNHNNDGDDNLAISFEVRDGCPHHLYANLAYSCGVLWLASVCAIAVLVGWGSWKNHHHSEEELELTLDALVVAENHPATTKSETNHHPRRNHRSEGDDAAEVAATTTESTITTITTGPPPLRESVPGSVASEA